MKQSGLASVAQLAEYDEIIDVRTPAEFAEDHVPGAINCPVLSNEERITVGTLYKQVSPFEAKKVGAALISINIARHLQERFHDRPKEWRPLIYCWRGGQRSGAMQIIFRQIGWKADKLDGGYKAFRQHVMEQIDALAPRFSYRVICGATGSGKTRILQALARQGAQVLDLETLAAHKGSVLGVLPGEPQPAQKGFETQLWQALAGFEAAHPVFVEAESRKIGRLHLPDSLLLAIRGGECLEVAATQEARVAFLLRDYDYFLNDPAWLIERLESLKALQGRENVAHWQALAQQGDWATLVQALLEKHYDPHYHRSQGQNYQGRRPHSPFLTDDLSDAAILRLAQRLRSAAGA
ncbi:tRNA 2-selenouridine synthase [Azospira sp. I13]|uniref:tRNA 2-selenouridine(34) synthase MnmH n=1 Tax=Azospira sp. I13 TaxID=1765050 RepID=UPI000D4FAA60|nr:tRNA 2-selenouridine(34) synthase MnmH [Azospira sp. I13]GBG03491.1 tRNA 2-selenouridine synthase [Azospira sp. I13]